MKSITRIVMKSFTGSKPCSNIFNIDISSIKDGDNSKRFGTETVSIRDKNNTNKYTNSTLSETKVFTISIKGLNFLNKVKSNYNKKYSRGGKSGEGLVGIIDLYRTNKSVLGNNHESLLNLSEEIQNRMRVKVSESYLNHAIKTPVGAKLPHPILKVVIPDVDEIKDLNGEIDPSNQNRYSFIPGLLHKYEMLLAYVSVNCSSHCRYCYRSDLFSGISNKLKADMNMVAHYISTYNNLIDNYIQFESEFNKVTGLHHHKQSREPLVKIREMLFSGGDVMTLPNATIARYMALMAEAGIKNIRLGTKEFVFQPQRMDSQFFKMLDLFHETYNNVRVDIVGHYVHPYEFTEPIIDDNGNYVYDVNCNYKIREDLLPVLSELGKRSEWISHYNQFPIIADINDSPEIIRLLLHLNRTFGIYTHNVYACREILGNKHFRGENTIIKQFNLLEEAKIGLSGLENHGRLIMSTEVGKTEVVGIDGNNVILKLNRLVDGNRQGSSTIIVDTSKIKGKFYWLTKEVIDSAVIGEGRNTIASIERDSFIKSVKRKAADYVLNNLTTKEDTEVNLNDNKNNSNIVELQIFNKEKNRKFVFDISKIKDLPENPTLATLLLRVGEIEAVCKEKLSCCTCVGDIESDIKSNLSEIKEDEIDLLDSVNKEISNKTIKANLRATCAIPLVPGKYKFKSLQLILENENEKNLKDKEF